MNSKADRFILIKLFGKLSVFRVNDFDPEFLSYLTNGLGAPVRKLRPVKNPALCSKCKYREEHCKAHEFCKNCEMLGKQDHCKCLLIKLGQACPYFVRAEDVEPGEKSDSEKELKEGAENDT